MTPLVFGNRILPGSIRAFARSSPRRSEARAIPMCQTRLVT